MPQTGRVELDERESKEVEERSLPRPHVVFETIRLEGEHELERSTTALLWSGLAAGLSMGFSLVATGVIHAALPDAPWRSLLESFGYTVGFLIVILGRQQLFTENTLTPVLPILVAPAMKSLRALGRLWGIVLAANVAGCACVGLVLARSPLFSPLIKDALDDVARHIVAATPLSAFWQAIFSGWLIALMVWLLPASQGGARPFVVVGLTYLIAICGFPHIVAGSVDAFYEIFRANVSLGTAVVSFFLPTLLGNIIGGVLLVSLLGFGQVFPDHVTTAPERRAAGASSRPSRKAAK